MGNEQLHRPTVSECHAFRVAYTNCCDDNKYALLGSFQDVTSSSLFSASTKRIVAAAIAPVPNFVHRPGFDFTICTTVNGKTHCYALALGMHTSLATIREDLIVQKMRARGQQNVDLLDLYARDDALRRFIDPIAWATFVGSILSLHSDSSVVLGVPHKIETGGFKQELEHAREEKSFVQLVTPLAHALIGSRQPSPPLVPEPPPPPQEVGRKHREPRRTR